MAKTKTNTEKEVLVKTYRPILNVSDLYVGRRYFLKLPGANKYTQQSVRDRISVNHRLGYHEGETIEEYNEYRKVIESWCRRGYLYDCFMEAIGANDDKANTSTVVTTKVSINPSNAPIELFAKPVKLSNGVVLEALDI